jgi:hypothetical protein
MVMRIIRQRGHGAGTALDGTTHRMVVDRRAAPRGEKRTDVGSRITDDGALMMGAARRGASDAFW